jgi:hypothetical protein
MKNVLALALTVLLSIFAFGCDDEKKEDPSDCAPVAGEVMAGEEEVAGEDVEAGEMMPDMEMPEAGQEEMDMEMPEAGEMMAGEEAEEEQPEG